MEILDVAIDFISDVLNVGTMLFSVNSKRLLFHVISCTVKQKYVFFLGPFRQNSQYYSQYNIVQDNIGQ